MKIAQQVLLIVLAILLVDQGLKIWLKLTMVMDDAIFIAPWFQLRFVENPGMAFSLELPGIYGKLLLTLFRVFAVSFIVYMIWKMIKEQKPKGLIWCTSMILAGAIGNIIDSMFYGVLFSDSYGRVAKFLPAEGGYAGFLQGHVVDMLYFPIIQGRFPSWVPVWGGDFFTFFSPIFNVADAAITIGVFLIFIFNKQFFPTETAPEVANTTEEPVVKG